MDVLVVYIGAWIKWKMSVHQLEKIRTEAGELY